MTPRGAFAIIFLLTVATAWPLAGDAAPETPRANEKPTMREYRIQFLGNVQTGRTEALIYFPGGTRDAEPWAIVYEGPDGWAIEIVGDASRMPLRTLETAVRTAREGLEAYVNRRGENPPPGLTPAGLSLWLMEKKDGTAMERPIK